MQQWSEAVRTSKLTSPDPGLASLGSYRCCPTHSNISGPHTGKSIRKLKKDNNPATLLETCRTEKHLVIRQLRPDMGHLATNLEPSDIEKRLLPPENTYYLATGAIPESAPCEVEFRQRSSSSPSASLSNKFAFLGPTPCPST